MKRTRHTTGQIIQKLREAEASEAAGQSTGQICQRLGVSEATLHRWRKRYGGMKPDEVRRLRELEQENLRLKKLVADLSLDKTILEEALKGKY
jgi:transposase-like protein